METGKVEIPSPRLVKALETTILFSFALLSRTESISIISKLNDTV